MTTEEICIELTNLAEQHELGLATTLPSDSVYSIPIFIETVRTLDIYAISDWVEKNPESNAATFDIIRMGWNLAASYLLKPFKVKGFPMRPSDENTQKEAFSILYNFGCCVQLRRTVEMVRAGMLTVEKNNNSFRFSKTGMSDNQHADLFEYEHFDKLENDILLKQDHYKNWNINRSETWEDVRYLPGSHLGIGSKDRFADHKLKDLKKEMLPLLREWDSGHGKMMAYDSSPKLDDHFLARAGDLVLSWRGDAGIHPDTRIGTLKGADLTWIIMILVSFDLKHHEFTGLAAGHFPDISIPQSVTIWQIKDELIGEIAAFTGLERKHVKEVIDLVTFRPSDCDLLKKHSSLFMPLLIDLDNGFVIRPLSAIGRNPFYSVMAVLEHRDPNFRHVVSVHREKWQRDELYASFQGNRYQRLEGNLKLRMNGKVLTDIDAAIFDNTNGELAIFQIKWQDFFFNDVKKLRSKASNLVRELDEWSEKVNHWISENGLAELRKLLGLKAVGEFQIKSVYLFGISRNAGRTTGYGFKRTAPDLVVANWPQFRRNRIEVGPVKNVISSLFSTLREQAELNIGQTPIPVILYMGDNTLVYDDLWFFHKKAEQRPSDR
ncbi:MAG TPA: hypothetical protein VGN20_14055 [Mucilaginibacter sp.]|jgi:hypothetical protein